MLVIYIDGIQFGDCHVIAALGVDSVGHKHVLAHLLQLLVIVEN